jgi:hypothetical protein
VAGEFRRYELTKGVNLYVRPETMFKTISLRMFLQQKLGDDTISANALVPRVMRRGTGTPICAAFPHAWKSYTARGFLAR